MTPVTMEDLIAKLEAATEGSRALDAAVSVAIGNADHGDVLSCMACHCAPLYSTSIDAALTLVPDGWSFRLERDAGDWWVELWSRGVTHIFSGGDMIRRCSGGDYVKSTGALIMCLEALRARLALMEIAE